MLGLDGEEELQEYEWEEAGIDNGTQKPEPPPLALWVAPWAAVGQGLLGQRPRQAGSPLRPLGPCCLGPPKSLLPISQSKWRPQTPASFLFFSVLRMPASSWAKAPALTLSSSPRRLPGRSPATDLPFPALLTTPFPSSTAARTVQIPVVPHLRGCSRLLIHPCFGTLCPSPCCLRCRMELSPAVLG